MNGVWRRAVLNFLGRALVLLAPMVVSVSHVDAAAITVSWTAPTTNANGSDLTDLASYRVYLGTSTPACPGGSFHTVASTTASPPDGQTVSSRITSLTASTTYFARVTAVDRSGNESGCSATASGVAHADLTVTPTTAVSFGTIDPGSTVDRTFTVKNTGTATVTGTSSVGSPFTIVSGGSFTLAAGASQAVVVRFRPTASGTFASNVTFTASGDTTTRPVNGTATGSAPSPPSGGALDVFITSPARGATVAASGTAVLWVEGTSGGTNTFTLSVDGRVESTQATSSRGPVSLPWTSIGSGTHTVTATVRDAAGQTGSTAITVSVPGGGSSPPPPPPPSSGLTLAITEPDSGEIVSGLVWVILWADGTQGTSNTFWITVDGDVVGSLTSPSEGPVAIPWTTTVSNGTHTLLAVVRDATGQTRSASITVNVRN